MLKNTYHTSTAYLVKQLPVPTLFIDKEFCIVYASDSLVSIFGKECVTISGLPLFSLFPELNIKWKQTLLDCFQGTSYPMGIQTFTDVSGREKHYEWSNASWYDTNENILGAIIQITDVTAEITSELSLEKSKFLIRQQSEISRIGIWEYDVIKNNLKWCNVVKAIHDMPLSYEPTLEDAIEFYKEGHSRNAISMAIFEAMDKGTPWNMKLEVVTAKGNEKWVVAAGKPIYENGRLVQIIGTFQDIHEQVLSDLKTKENSKLLKTLIDHLPVNVYIKDRDSKKILVNKSECNYLGITDSNELLGKSDFDLYPYETAKISRDEDLQVMETLKPILSRETINNKNDGSETVFLSSKIPLLDENGLATGLVGISLDITNIKEKEQELRNLINVTSLQNKKLINFAHIVSHNLRSHSANFSMLLDFLVDEKNEEEKTKIVKMLVGASNNLLETLENLNEAITLSTDNQAKKEDLNLYHKITGICESLASLIDNDKLQIINTVAKDINIKIVPAYLDSILMNFVTNGVKYKHPDREPVLKFSSEKEGDYTVLNIEDNGLGIDLKKHGSKLFGMYKTFHTHKDSKGMGLYITKNQVEAMHGKIEVQSEVGKGTKFKVFFK